MEAKLKQRILGGIVIAAIVVIVVPFFFGHDDKAATQQVTLNAQIPPAPIPPTLSMNDPNAPTAIQSQESQQLNPQAGTQPEQAVPPNEATDANQVPPVATTANAIPTPTVGDDQDASASNNNNTGMPAFTPSTVTANTVPVQQPAFNPQASPPAVIAPPPAAVVTPAPKKATVKTAVVVPKNSSTAAVKQASVAMRTKQPSSVTEAWAVQVGSFSKAQNAHVLVAKLKTSGLPAYTETTKTSHGTVTRVLVGPEVKKQNAEVIVSVLQQKYQINAVVIPYEKAKA